MKYVCIIEPDPGLKGEPGYHVYFPSLKTCNTFGATIEETLANAREALDAYLESLEEDGVEAPPADVPEGELGATPVLISVA